MSDQIKSAMWTVIVGVVLTSSAVVMHNLSIENCENKPEKLFYNVLNATSVAVNWTHNFLDVDMTLYKNGTNYRDQILIQKNLDEEPTIYGEQFKERLELNKYPGIASMKLSSVSESDNGTYFVRVTDVATQNQYIMCNATLNVINGSLLNYTIQVQTDQKTFNCPDLFELSFLGNGSQVNLSSVCQIELNPKSSLTYEVVVNQKAPTPVINVTKEKDGENHTCEDHTCVGDIKFCCPHGHNSSVIVMIIDFGVQNAGPVFVLLAVKISQTDPSSKIPCDCSYDWSSYINKIKTEYFFIGIGGMFLPLFAVCVIFIVIDIKCCKKRTLTKIVKCLGLRRASDSPELSRLMGSSRQTRWAVEDQFGYEDEGTQTIEIIQQPSDQPPVEDHSGYKDAGTPQSNMNIQQPSGQPPLEISHK